MGQGEVEEVGEAVGRSAVRRVEREKTEGMEGRKEGLKRRL